MEACAQAVGEEQMRTWAGPSEYFWKRGEVVFCCSGQRCHSRSKLFRALRRFGFSRRGVVQVHLRRVSLGNHALANSSLYRLQRCARRSAGSGRVLGIELHKLCH